jgi:hypothetical protein
VMRGWAKAGAVVALCVFASSCASAFPTEAEAMERLAATEAAATRIIEAALGADAVTDWELERGLPTFPCSPGCDTAVSEMRPAGSYSEDVLDRFTAPALAAGAQVTPVRRTFMEGALLISTLTVYWDRAEGLYRVEIAWEPESNSLDMAILIGSFRVSSG